MSRLHGLQIRDLENRSVLDLVEGLKGNIPNDAAVAQRKFALERCTEILTGEAAHPAGSACSCTHIVIRPTADRPVFCPAQCALDIILLVVRCLHASSCQLHSWQTPAEGQAQLVATVMYPSAGADRPALTRLAGTLFDELEPRQLLDVRTNEDGTKDFLVQWPDEAPDSWVGPRPC
jgi:hypothetical protein